MTTSPSETRGPIKVAAVQASPVYFDLEACLAKAAVLVKEAAESGCKLVAFGEAWFPGYPFHIWLGAPAWSLQFHNIYHENSMVLGSHAFEQLRDLARQHEVMISAGISERDKGSLYLSQLLIGEDGEVLSVRRKLKPTHVERTVFGEGYGADLKVTQTNIGRIGQLCCWEHIQPLSKYAMFSQHEELHISAWPAFIVYREQAHALSATVNMAASRVYAVEGQCFVIAATSVIDQASLDYFKVGTEVPPLIELGGGSAMIFAPDGRQLAEYLPETKEGLVIADLDFSQITMAKAVADPTGHYSKPEATRLLWNKKPQTPTVDVPDVEGWMEVE